MQPREKYRFLFASAMFTGNETFFLNLRQAIEAREDIDATWLPIELDPPELIAKIHSNYLIKDGLVARKRVLALESAGKRFDAA